MGKKANKPDVKKKTEQSKRGSQHKHGKYHKSEKKPHKKGKDDEDCLVTTAAVCYFGHEDDCPELDVLREFRDKVLHKTDEGRVLVNKYYKLAPKLIFKIEQNPQKHMLYSLTYNKMLEICKYIESGKYNTAIAKYQEFILNFKQTL